MTETENPIEETKLPTKTERFAQWLMPVKNDVKRKSPTSKV